MVVELDTSTPNETTLALIKPDAVAAGKARDIMHIIESNGFHIIEKKYIKVSRSFLLESLACVRVLVCACAGSTFPVCSLFANSLSSSRS